MPVFRVERNKGYMVITMAEIACAFAGYRPKSFPWGYDENAPDCVLLKEVLATHISSLAVSSPVIKCKKTPRKKCSFVAEVKGKR